MAQSGKERLLSLLFEEGRELINLKFFPSDQPSTEEQFCTAAADVIELVKAEKFDASIPQSGIPSRSFAEALKG